MLANSAVVMLTSVLLAATQDRSPALSSFRISTIRFGARSFPSSGISTQHAEHGEATSIGQAGAAARRVPPLPPEEQERQNQGWAGLMVPSLEILHESPLAVRCASEQKSPGIGPPGGMKSQEFGSVVFSRACSPG